MGEISTESFQFDDGVTVEVTIDSGTVDEKQPVDEPDSDNEAPSAVSTAMPANAESPAMAMGNGYQIFSQSMSLLAQNAVNIQQQLTMTQQTTVHQELQRVIFPTVPQTNVNSQNSLESLQGIIAMLSSPNKSSGEKKT